MTNRNVILVIDDKEDHANATAEALQKVGYKCLVATSGREGLRIIETGNVDIAAEFEMSKNRKFIWAIFQS